MDSKKDFGEPVGKHNMGTQLNIFDCSRGRRNPVSKKVHACKIVTKKATMQDKVFALIEMAAEKGLTVYELSDALTVPVHSLSGRLSELSFVGRIVSGETRPNRFGNECTVWRRTAVTVG